MKLSEKIKFLRKEQQLTLQQLSNKSGLSVVSLVKYESGKRTPSLISIQKLAEGLNCSFDELYNLR